MVEVDTSGWKKLDVLDSGEWYEVEPAVVAIVPFDGHVETEADALEAWGKQQELCGVYGQPIHVIVFLDRVATQQGSARRVWSEVAHPDVLAGAAFVCSSFFARAVGSFFMGIRAPRSPTVMVDSLEEAFAWIRAERKRG